MKQPQKIIKTYRLQQHLVDSIDLMSEQMHCTKTHVIEYALAKLIFERDMAVNRSLPKYKNPGDNQGSV